MKALFLPVVGLPNVGKSTLINSLLGKKVSIVTHKPHTTRSLITTNDKHEGYEVFFIDTPGIEKVTTKLGRVIYDSMCEYVDDAESLLLVLDANNPSLNYFEKIISKSVVVINKVDAIRKPKLLPLIDELYKKGAKEIFMISAKTGDGLEALKDFLKITAESEEEVPSFGEFHEDIVSYACECVREKILVQADEEVPYNILIEPVKARVPLNSAWHISLKIIVPKESYKPILIGKKGSFLKAIGTAVRLELSAKLKQPGFLNLQVSCQPKLWELDSTYQKLGWDK